LRPEKGGGRERGEGALLKDIVDVIPWLLQKNASFPFACTSKYKVLVSRGNISPRLLLLNTPFKILFERFAICPSIKSA